MIIYQECDYVTYETDLDVVEDEADKVGAQLLKVVHRHRLASAEYGGEKEGAVTHPEIFS